MSTPEPLHALRRASPRRHASFAASVDDAAEAVRRRIDCEATGGADARPRTRRLRVSLAGASLAAIGAAVASLTFTSLGGAPGAENAEAAIARAANVSSASADRSGIATLRITHNGEPWGSTAVRWHGDDVAIRSGQPSRSGRPGSEMLVVDGVLYGLEDDGSWVALGDPSSIDADSGTTPAEYLAAVREDVGGATLRRFTRAMTGLSKRRLADGATLYEGSLRAGELARETGFKEGQALRVLAFGFVAHGEAANPAAELRASVTVGPDGLVRMVAASWGEGGDASAWTYTVAYSDLGSAPEIAAPANARSLRELRKAHRQG